jgi:integrase
VVSERRNGARWVVALALGLRQGEALGLKWSDVNLDKGTLRIRRGRLRPKYVHGCDGDCAASLAIAPRESKSGPTRETPSHELAEARWGCLIH